MFKVEKWAWATNFKKTTQLFIYGCLIESVISLKGGDIFSPFKIVSVVKVIYWT